MQEPTPIDPAGAHRPRFVSLGAVLDRTQGVGQGFDTLRTTLSISILCWHSIVTSYGRDAELPFWSHPLVGGVVASLLPVFFALSGFLVMGSALRTLSLRVFVMARVLRILPALATEVTISAVLLGGAVTTLPLRDYYTDPAFVRYFGSLTGAIQQWLPGVFADNPFENVVNSSLWTIPPELLCYCYVASVIAAGLLGMKRLLSALIVAAALAAIAADVAGFGTRGIGMSVRMHTLILAFALGNLLYLWRHAVPHGRGCFLVCLVLGIGLVARPGMAALSLPFLVYVTAYLGTLKLPRIPLLDRGDYSYGIYLYAMPVQQSFAFFFPRLREWYWNILFALPVTVAIAMLSWTCIELQALRLRRRSSDTAEHRRNKHAPGVSPALLGLILAYALWLYGTQYPVRFLELHPKLLPFAGACFAVTALALRRRANRLRTA